MLLAAAAPCLLALSKCSTRIRVAVQRVVVVGHVARRRRRCHAGAAELVDVDAVASLDARRPGDLVVGHDADADDDHVADDRCRRWWTTTTSSPCCTTDSICTSRRRSTPRRGVHPGTGCAEPVPERPRRAGPGAASSTDHLCAEGRARWMPPRRRRSRRRSRSPGRRVAGACAVARRRLLRAQVEDALTLGVREQSAACPRWRAAPGPRATRTRRRAATDPSAALILTARVPVRTVTSWVSVQSSGSRNRPVSSWVVRYSLDRGGRW